MADDDDQPETSVASPAKAQTINGQTVIKLDGHTQQLSGIVTLTLKPAHHQTEFLAYGKAISIQPLLGLHQRFLAALTERKRANAKFELAEQSFSRQQDLFRHGATAKRNLQDQQAQWQSDKASLEATQYQDQAIIDEARLNWGKTLASWALSERANQLATFLDGQQTLLHITLPSHHSPAENLHTIAVDVAGDRGNAQTAEFISAAPQTEGNGQGLSYFFRVSGKTIKTGMSVSAWLPEQGQQQDGVLIPANAVCWTSDQASVYVKTADDTFSRRTIGRYTPTTGGYFLSDTLKPGDAIVTTGAQMLLSEEMRGQIPSEDND